jgi:hypothetical protein
MKTIYAVCLAIAVLYYGPSTTSILLGLFLFWFFSHFLHD